VAFYDSRLAFAARKSADLVTTLLVGVDCHVSVISVVVVLNLQSAKLDEEFLDEVLE
jgi:hypothetical protein